MEPTLYDISGQLSLLEPLTEEQERKNQSRPKRYVSEMDLVAAPYQYLDLTPGHGDLLGDAHWEFRSSFQWDGSILNTGLAPRRPIISSLSKILEKSPDKKYYLSKTACLGILRRADERGKELPHQLKAALMAQAGIIPPESKLCGLKAYHINQRDEGIGLDGVAGALMATTEGVPAQAQRSGLRGERRNSGMSEPCRLRQGEGYGACDDAQMQTFVTGEPIAFAANQRDEVRDLHDVAGAICACQTMKQQTFIQDGCLTPWDTQQKRISLPDGVAPTLAGADGGGGRAPGGLLFAAAFAAGTGAKAGGIGYSETAAPTLKGSPSGNCMPSVLCLNDQGGERMDLTIDQTTTLRSQAGGHQPLILNDQGGAVMSVSEDLSGTLRAQEHGHQPLVFDTHGQDCRFQGPFDTAQPVTATFGMGGGNTPLVVGEQDKSGSKRLIFENHGIDSRYTGPHRTAPTLSARAGTGGNNLPLVAEETAEEETSILCITGNAIDRQPQNGGNGLGIDEGVAFTLTATDRHAVFSRQRVDVFKAGEVVSTESARQHKDATDLVYQETVGALTSSDRKGPNSQYVGQDKLVVDGPLLIRRLTPLECERLQGFPDGWTDIPGASDSARYKALGNSVAIPCVEFVLAGIALAIFCG